MTVQKVLDIFDILQDKYGAPYFPDEWKVEMLNLACNDYLNDITPDNQGGIINFEADSNVIANYQNLIYTLTLSMSSSGLVSQSSIVSLLQSQSGDSGAKVHRYMSVGVLSGGIVYPVRYVKQNNLHQYQTNVFKQPSVPERVMYTMLVNGLQFYPTSTATPLTFVVIKTPKVITTSDLSFVLEFPDYVVNRLLVFMLEKAGIATRDVELQQDIRMAQGI